MQAQLNEPTIKNQNQNKNKNKNKQQPLRIQQAGVQVTL
jgi:hypothetical protein